MSQQTLQPHAFRADCSSVPRWVEAWRSPSWPGLVIHHYLGFEGQFEKAWTVSHEASGQSVIVGARTRDEAIEWADAFAALGDWTRPAEELFADKPFRALARELRAHWMMGCSVPAISDLGPPVPSTSRGL